MPLLPTVGHKTLSMRFITALMYLALTLGGVTMVYPLLITLTASVTNSYDYEEFGVFPKYLFSREERYKKFLIEKYFDRPFNLFASNYDLPSEWNAYWDLRQRPGVMKNQLSIFGSDSARGEQLKSIAADYDAFMKQLDSECQLVLMQRLSQGAHREFLKDRYESHVNSQLKGRAREAAALDLMAADTGEGKFSSFEYITYDVEKNFPFHVQRWFPEEVVRYHNYLDYVRSLPSDWKMPQTAKYMWLLYLMDRGKDIKDLNKEWSTDYASIYSVPFPSRAPVNPNLREMWAEFVKEHWPLRLVQLPLGLDDAYRKYLQQRTGSIERYNRLCGTRFGSFAEMSCPLHFPRQPLVRNYWVDFVLSQVPISEWKLLTAEDSYRGFLLRKYQNAEALNQAYGWHVASFDEINFPFKEIDYQQFVANESFFTRFFLTFNYSEVLKFITTRGRSLFNTVALVALTVLATLTVNPLAAYALSRFQLKATQKILIFLLATMAFPAEVAMIPNFLLLRDLHLLNTFGALILPGLANGFSIFLLKGFFDSLPQELFEAATIDGASELKTFWRLTLPLTKPILAVISLNAFIAAYGGFMWAFLVCQDERMWTLMVWIYKFNLMPGTQPYMAMAAFVLVSIPTLLVFLFCQNIILRGIVVPQMK